MSEVIDKVVDEVKHLFIFEKTAVQKFLDYLAKRPYAEVFEIIEAIKTGKVVTAPAAAAPQTVTPEQAQAQTDGVQQSLNPNS